MENIHQHLIYQLNLLVEMAKDGQKGYENAAIDINDDLLKKSFLMWAKEREVYANQLQQEVHNLDGIAEHSGGAFGGLHRLWMDMKSIFTSGDKVAIINACITGEETAIQEYKKIINDTPAGAIKRLMTDQMQGIERILSDLKSRLPSSRPNPVFQKKAATAFRE